MSKDDTEKDESMSDAARVKSGDQLSASASASKPKSEGGSAYEEYLYGRNILSTYKLKPNWSSTTKGRLTIRLFSRGVAGALAFAFAQRYAANQLRNYEPSTFNKWGEVKFSEKPLQYVAKFFDVAAGKPIEAFVKLTASGDKSAAAYNATRFRPKYYFHDTLGHNVGRSLGAEIVAVTFDFSAMSFADAMTRNIIQAFDPNLPQPWYVDKQGHAATREHGKFNVEKLGKAAIRATWRSLTKNAGEDWFAALPYIYQMKWQREAISKIPAFTASAKDSGKQFDGFKISSDRNRNGGNLIVNTDGKIVGDYQLAGVLDLQNRFVGYNVYTLMYRELYDTVSRNLWHAYKHGVSFDFKMPKTPVDAVVDGIGSAGRYLIKSTIKANLFMQPSVPFFWLFRVPQSKWKSEIILQGGDPTQNSIGTWGQQKPGTEDPHRPGKMRYPYPMPYDTWVRPTKGLTGRERPDTMWFGNQQVPFSKSLKEKGLYHFDNCPTLVSKILNPFGWLSYNTGTALAKAAESFAPDNSTLGKILAGGAAKNIALDRTLLLRNYVDAAYAYTPYFMAKDEFGLRVNDTPANGELGKMDKAIYGLIDNAFTLRFKKAGDSLGQIWKLSTDDLKKKEVTHYEGKDVTKDAPARIPTAPPANHAPTQPVSNIKPTTKVQATTVQYNTAPPTHLSHATSTEAATKNTATPAPHRDEHDRWVDSLAERKSAPVQNPNPTVH